MFLTVAVVLLISAQSLQSTGIVRGSVYDQTRALIPGMELTLSDLEKSYARRVSSNARGEFSIEAPAGVYELRAELPGFETSITRPLRLRANETLQTDITAAVKDSLTNVPLGLTTILKRDGLAHSGFAGKWRVEQKGVMNVELEFNVEGDKVTGTAKRGGLGADIQIIHDGKLFPNNLLRFRTTVTVDPRTGRAVNPPAVTAWTAELLDDNTIRVGWQLELVGTNILELLSVLPGAAR